MLFTDILEQADVGASPINTLAKRGIVEVYVQDVMRDPLAGADFPDRDDFTLTDEQQAALGQITTAVEGDSFKAFLLHGVTGSGKTEVYIRAMQFTLDAGRSAMMLVPEIALTPVFSRRLRAVFGSDVAILHSNLSPGERFDEWRRIRRGDARIAIGTRSAVFAPLENIGLVIVDEEHDPSYRQHESPFYHARDVGVMRAHLAGAVVVLGSATPAMESFYNAQTGKYTYLHLPDRIGGRGLATAELIDMREVFKRAGKDVALSPELLDAIKATHAKGEQVIILLNRRGFSQFVLCRTCGETLKCKNCDITLTFHRGDNKLLCHYCNYREKSPKVCPHCQSEYLYFVGEGTENIADQLTKKFPDADRPRRPRHDGPQGRDGGCAAQICGRRPRYARRDADDRERARFSKRDAGRRDLGRYWIGAARSAFGGADVSANNAGRRTLRAAGRAGKVLIQTYYPEHYALRHAREQDYEGFYDEEIKFRERLGYPPFFVLASIMIKHRDHAYASKTRIFCGARSMRQTRPEMPEFSAPHRLPFRVSRTNTGFRSF